MPIQIKNKFISCFILLVIISQSQFRVFAQTRRASANNQTSAAQTNQAAKKCSGAWTGVVSYTRTQSNSDNKTVERVSGRGSDTRDWQMKYDYKATVAVVEAPERNGSIVGKANINHSFSSIEKISAKEKNSCDRGKTWREMSGESISKTETSGNASGLEANVSVGVNADGSYAISVGVPQIQGKTTGSQSLTFSGQCTTKEGKNLSLPPTETTIEGNSLTTDGSHRINFSDPNRLSGSYSKTWQNVTETITWNLQKCGAPLRLIDLKFEHPKFPDFNNWQEIAEQTGTVDGNMVKIKAKVLNASGETKFADVKFKETFKGDKWDGAKPDSALGDNTVSVRLEAGEEREVEMIWDSSGYAWFDDGRPRLVQRIKAELEENGKKSDELTKNLKVAPKPLVLVHGLWSSWRAWESWQNILTTAHSYDWKAFPVGEKPEKGLMNTGGEFMSSNPTNTVFENAQQLGRYIRYAQEDRNAWHVDVAAHSMGGLISRYYVHSFMPADSPDGRPQIAHLIMLGTPNLGSPCADVMDFKFETFGQTVEAVRQLKPAAMAEFNRTVKGRKGVKFSALAGNPLPVMCKNIEPNDGVVSVSSAIWNVTDHAFSKNIHTELTGTADFSSFVKPRLAIGPKGNHNPAQPESNEFSSQSNSNDFGDENRVMFVNANYRRQTDFAPVYFGKDLKLAAKQAGEIEIPVPSGEKFGITLMANSRISAILIDDKGAVLGKNAADSPESRLLFRTIFVDKPTTAKTVRLRLANTDSSLDAIVLLTAWRA